jgi:hypothetical protein
MMITIIKHFLVDSTNRLSELRNHVYDIAAEETADRGVVPVAHDPDNQTQWEFSGLMKTCKQIRGEFRPLYMAAVALSIELPDLAAFEEVFLVDASHPKSVEIWLDQRTIRSDTAERSLSYYGNWYEIFEVDLTSLIRTICSSTRKFVTFSCRLDEYDDIAPNLNRIFDNKAAWLAVLEQAVKNVEISPKAYDSICLEMEGFTFMSYREMEDFLKRLGFDDTNQVQFWTE